MVTKFPCPACQAVLQLSQTPPPGARIRCPKCQNVFIVKAAPVPVGAGAGPRGNGAGQMQRPAGRSSQRMQAPAVGGSGARMQAAPPGRSSQRMQAPAVRPGSRANMPPPEEDYEEAYDDRPRRKPRKKSQSGNLGMILGVIGGLAALVIMVIVGIIMFGGKSGGGDDLKNPDILKELERKKQALGITLPQQNQRPTQPANRGRTEPTKPKLDDDGGSDSGGASGGSGGESAAAPSRGSTPSIDPNANPFEGLNFGALPAKNPRQLAGLKFVPAASDAIVGMDLEPIQNLPQLSAFLRRVLMTQGAEADSPLAKLVKEMDGNPLVELVQGSKVGKVTAGMNAQKSGAAVEWTTYVLKAKNPVDAAALSRALLAEAIPALDGLKCHSVPAAEVGGVKFHFFLCFPDGDDRTVILSQAQQNDLDPLIRRGGELNPTLNAVFDAIEPCHVWSAMSMEPLKPMLGMLTLMGAQAPPEGQALLKDLPKAQGLILQIRLQDNQAKLAVGLTFPNDAQTLGFVNGFKDLWTKSLQPQLGAMAGQGGKAAEELLRNMKVGQRRSAALASTSVSVGALKEGYPQLAGMMASMGSVAGGAPAGGGMDSSKPPEGMPSMPTNGKMSKSNPNAPYGVAEGERAPDIAGKDLDGKAMKLSDYKGKVVLLDFWAYWCGPCVSMFPHNKELVEKYKGRPFVILGVNEDRAPKDITNGNAKHKLTWRSFQDGTAGSKIVRQYKIEAFPTMMILDGNGVVRKVIVGAGGQNAALLDKTIAELVAELE